MTLTDKWLRFVCAILGHKYEMEYSQFTSHISNTCSRCKQSKWNI
jgi:hypothetical protein